MFKFIKAKGPHLSAERQKLQKELFSYRRTLQHGFPHKPTALAWDPSLRLLCIGTATGAVKVFGRPGVEFYGQHQNPIPVTRIVFLPNQGRVVSLCDDNSLHLWEVNKSSLVEVKAQALEGKLKKISTMCVDANGKELLLGTEGGNIYLLDLITFTMTPDIIYQDVVMQNVPQDYKLNPGAVEAIFEQPEHPNNILIGYNRGLIVLWNRADTVAIQTFVANQQLESLCWHEDGKNFTSSHNDGSYMVWDIEQSEKPSSEPTTTYGPFPCRAIPKIIRHDFKSKPLIVFSGGLPRSSGSDKYTISVIHDEEHVAFDFTSKVIDFILINTKMDRDTINGNDVDDDDDAATDNNSQDETNGLSNGSTISATTINNNNNNNKNEPEALVVLAEEELIVIDLQSKEWKMMNLPYLVSLHASAVTCSQHVSGVPEELWEQLKDAGRTQTSHLYSNRAWPIDGGKLLCSKGTQSPRRELLLTGHEDGTVRFWDAGGVTLTPIYKFSTAQFFTGDDLEEAAPDPEDVEDEWPPFRKTGIFDPYSDDPRLAVKKVVLCPLSGTLVIAGTAGHVVLAKFDTEVLDAELKSTIMNIVNDRDSFIWKGHNQLTPKSGDLHQIRGFQATTILQLHPPAAVTACVLQADWGLIAAGTAHGLAVFDYIKNRGVMVKCTLNPNDLTGAGGGDTPISRRKSFKKSLRESFRRLRKGRSTRRGHHGNTTTVASPPTRRTQITTTTAATTTTTSPTTNAEDGSNFNPLEAKPVERQIEARQVDDSMSSFVRCLYFARTFLLNVQNTNPTLWAGTNNGTVYTFTISVPSGGRRETDDVTCHIAKEIQLKHRAPVIAIAVLDGSNKPLPEPLEVERGVAPLPDTTQAHRVIIASEEQFKIFTLPSVKAFCKYKLTAHEGARVRRMAFGNFSCTLPESNHSEVDLLCLTNLGDCLVLSIPDLKRQLNAAAIKREDINGISSLVFTKDSEALYLHSSSELQRISLAMTRVTSARCYLPLPIGARDDTTSDIGSTTTTDETANIVDRRQEATSILVNGNTNDSGNISKDSGGSGSLITADKTDESIKENGDDTLHNVTVSSSVGDITIDSVKDYLGSGEELNRRISGLCVTKTITTIVGNNQENVVTTTTMSSSNNNNINNNNATASGAVATTATSSTTTTSTTNNTAAAIIVQENIIESVTEGSTPILETKKVHQPLLLSDVMLRAPLALAEELLDLDNSHSTTATMTFGDACYNLNNTNN